MKEIVYLVFMAMEIYVHNALVYISFILLDLASSGKYYYELANSCVIDVDCPAGTIPFAMTGNYHCAFCEGDCSECIKVINYCNNLKRVKKIARNAGKILENI